LTLLSIGTRFIPIPFVLAVVEAPVATRVIAVRLEVVSAALEVASGTFGSSPLKRLHLFERIPVSGQEAGYLLLSVAVERKQAALHFFLNDHRFERTAGRSRKTSGRPFNFIFRQNGRSSNNSRRNCDHDIDLTTVRRGVANRRPTNGSHPRMGSPWRPSPSTFCATLAKRSVLLFCTRAVPLIVRSVNIGFCSVPPFATSFRLDLHRHLHILIRENDRLEF
jgi:hypothetical protein